MRHLKYRAGFIAAAVVVAAAAQAPANAFNLQSYGQVGTSDLANVVTPRFERLYPAPRYTLQVFAQSGLFPDGRPWCFAYAGVDLTRNRKQVPVLFAHSTQDNLKPMSQQQWERVHHSYEMGCAVAATQILMRAVDHGTRIYYAHQPRNTR
jgi:hypothetical protein